jgi:hypothetical protein
MDAAVDGDVPDAGGLRDAPGRLDAAVDGRVVRDAAPVEDAALVEDAGCPDADRDGVCNGDDVCPSSDDRADRDMDGAPDGCDACPDDASDDSDGDAVCDSADVCPGSDDALDEDGDGTPDGCDPCPIDGPSAPPIPATVASGGITISAVSLAGGGNVAVVDPGASVSVSLRYAITDCVCSGCIDQIEIGLVPGPSFQYCAYSSQPGCGGDTGTDTDTLRAPSAPGVYSVRFGKGQNYGCTHTSWWQGTPGTERTIGAICVR